jgi:transposase
MPEKIYVVDLTEDERVQLLDLIRAGETSARKLRRAHTLLLADEGQSDTTIASVLHIGASTVQRTRQRFVEGNLERALNERPRPGQRPKLDDKAVMVLATLARSAPPEGHKCWTMQLLAERLVELKVVDCISDETVRRGLKKSASSPG